MRADENIQKRLEELQKTVEKKVVEAVKIDRQWVIETLLRNTRICMGDEKVTVQKTDKDGNVKTAELTMRDAAQANAALKLLGQIPEVGLFKEEGTGDVNVNNNFLSPQPLPAESIAEITNRFGAKIVEFSAKKASGA
jgi:hypothetical protein